jgi:hypothetical protein
VKEPLLSLASSELRQLAGALESGRLTPPYSAMNLQRFVTQSAAGVVASSITELAESGCSPLALSRVLKLLATEVEQRPLLEDLVDLVATGPEEAEGTPRLTSVVVGDLFRGAKKSVLVVGYAVRQGQKVFKDLADKMAECPELRVRLYLDIQRTNDDTSLPDEIATRFSRRFRSTEWPLQRPIPEIYFDPRSIAIDRSKAGAPHAKCVVVDGERLFVSSANFTEAAQERNIELGILLNSPILAGRVSEFFDRLVHMRLLKRLF